MEESPSDFAPVTHSLEEPTTFEQIFDRQFRTVTGSAISDGTRGFLGRPCFTDFTMTGTVSQ